MVVADEEAKILIQAMDAAEKISGQMTIITAEIKQIETENPENTEEAPPKA